MEKLLKIPYNVFNDWNQLQQFLERKGNPRYELVGNVFLANRKDISDLGNLVRVDGELILYRSSIQSLGNLEYVGINLDLRYTPIKSLGNLVRVDGYLWLDESSIESLGNLEYVGGDFDLRWSSIQSLGNLEYVGKGLYLQNTPIQSLGNLEYVGDIIYLSRNHQIPEEQLTKFKIKYV